MDNILDGIEILVDMAKSGKIDPWNIDIVDATDKFLKELVEIKSNNLRLSGRTLFFAAVLLRLKSDILEGIDPLAEQQDEFTQDYDDMEMMDDDFYPEQEENINKKNIISLDNVLARRTSVRVNKRRVITLKDLIEQLEFYEKREKKRSKRQSDKNKRDIRSYANFTADDILDMAHDEYIEDSIDQLHDILTRLLESNEKVEINELYKTGMDKATTYITLLFLAARSRIDLVQEEFYSDLYIVQEVG